MMVIGNDDGYENIFSESISTYWDCTIFNTRVVSK